MPQLDKVTFLSQFFWFCVVFIGMYLILVKFFLPALARIVKVRQVLSNSAASESTQSVNTNANEIYSNSLEATLSSFKSYMDFLSRWNATQLSTIVPQISPDFISKYSSLRKRSLAVETYINNIVPPVGRSQNLVFESQAHQTMFTKRIHSAILAKVKSRKVAKGKANSSKAAAKKETKAKR